MLLLAALIFFVIISVNLNEISYKNFDVELFNLPFLIGCGSFGTMDAFVPRHFKRVEEVQRSCITTISNTRYFKTDFI